MWKHSLFLISAAILLSCAKPTAAPILVNTSTRIQLGFEAKSQYAAVADEIDRVFPTKLPDSPAEPTDSYGEAVNGLAMRIDAAMIDGPIMVRLRNVGRNPIILPADWRWKLKSMAEDAGDANAEFNKDLTELFSQEAEKDYQNQRAVFPEQAVAEELKPGETAGVMVMSVDFHTETEGAVRLRLVVPEGNGHWNGEISSPEFICTRKMPSGKLPCPTYPERFDARRQPLKGYGQSYDGAFADLLEKNRGLIHSQQIYDDASLRRHYEKAMRFEASPGRRVAIASLAAQIGSRDAMRELLRQLASAEWEPVEEAEALLIAAQPQLMAGSDGYQVSGFEPRETPTELQAVMGETAFAVLETRWRAGRVGQDQPVAERRGNDSADDQLIFLTGETCGAKAVPLLLEMLEKETNMNAVVAALGAIGDPRALPPLEKIMRNTRWGDWPAHGVALTLRRLKSPALVPFMLERVYDARAIQILGICRDERAVEPLKKVVAECTGPSGRVEVDVTRGEAALLALAKISNSDLQASEIVRDRTRSLSVRRDAMYELGRRQTPVAMAVLVAAAQQDESCDINEVAIRILSTFKNRAAAEALVECFEIDYSKHDKYGMRRDAEMQDNIGDALRRMTGAKIDNNKQTWAGWLEVHGEAFFKGV